MGRLRVLDYVACFNCNAREERSLHAPVGTANGVGRRPRANTAPKSPNLMSTSMPPRQKQSGDKNTKFRRFSVSIRGRGFVTTNSQDRVRQTLARQSVISEGRRNAWARRASFRNSMPFLVMSQI